MKLRIAKKICKAIGTERERAYTEDQLCRAWNRTERTLSNRKAKTFFNAIMLHAGTEGRAKIIRATPAEELAMLLRDPVEAWPGMPWEDACRLAEQREKQP